MFCPRCGVEYRDGFQECVDCGVRLVKERPTKPIQESIREPIQKAGPSNSESIAFVTVLESNNRSEIGLAESLLQAAGIRYWSRGNWTPAITWGGYIELLVEQKDAGAARQVLARPGGSRSREI